MICESWIYIYIYIYIHTHTHIYIYIYKYTYIYIRFGQEKYEIPYEIPINLKYGGYQRGLESMIHKF